MLIMCACMQLADCCFRQISWSGVVKSSRVMDVTCVFQLVTMLKNAAAPVPSTSLPARSQRCFCPWIHFFHFTHISIRRARRRSLLLPTCSFPMDGS